MICSRRLYKGESYEICLPIADTGITSVRFYTDGDITIEKEPEISGDTMCFILSKEDLDMLHDGVLRYSYDGYDSNTGFVVVTPGDYSGSTLDDLLEDAFDSGYTAGQEDCSGGTCEGVYESGYTSGYTDGFDTGYDSGFTDGFVDGYGSGTTDGFEGGYSSGKTDGYDEGWGVGYDSGFTDGQSACSGTGNEDLIANLEGRYYVIPEGTTNLRAGALSYGLYPYFTSNYSTLTIPSSVRRIGTSAFANNTSFSAITIPESVTGFSQASFYGTHVLRQINIPSGVTEIPAECFYGAFASDNIYHTAATLPQMQFYVPPQITGIGVTAFAENTELTDVIFEGSGVTAIATGCFRGCTSLTGLTLPNTITSIGRMAFQGCAFSSFTIPSGVTEIGQYAFSGCSRLTGITIPASVTDLASYTFSRCTSLSDVVIQSGVTHIAGRVFEYCSGITRMVFEGTTPPTIDGKSGTNASLGSVNYTFPIYVPCESVDAYKTAFGTYYAPRITCISPGPEPPEPSYSAMPLTFEIISGGTIGWDNSQNHVEIEYSTDSGQTWNTFATLNVNAGDHVMFRGSGATAQGISSIARFTASTDTYFVAYGYAYSLLDWNNYADITNLSAYTSGLFFGLFSGNTGLLSAENLKLQAETLCENCYRDMFSCCTNLTTAPELPAETLEAGSYWNMFAYCSNLNYIKCLAIDRTATGCTSVWVTNVPQFGGTFVKHPNATWGKGMNEIPAGWTVQDAQI